MAHYLHCTVIEDPAVVAASTQYIKHTIILSLVLKHAKAFKLAFFPFGFM